MALFPALVFLVILAMLGLAALGNSALEERMAGNAKDENLAFQAAEAALRDAEADIDANLTPTSPFSSTCGSGLCTPPSTWPSASSADIAKLIDWSNAAVTRAYGANTGATSLPVVAAQPRYVVELLSKLAPSPAGSAGLGVGPGPKGGAVYRITALGTGARAETRVVMQSTYIVRSP
jgi:type IV pilus assembly protein PilX